MNITRFFPFPAPVLPPFPINTFPVAPEPGCLALHLNHVLLPAMPDIASTFPSYPQKPCIQSPNALSYMYRKRLHKDMIGMTKAAQSDTHFTRTQEANSRPSPVPEREHNATDIRKHTPSGFDRYREVIEVWLGEVLPADEEKPPLTSLHRKLRDEHGCKLSYSAFRRFINNRYPEYHLGTALRQSPSELSVIENFKKLNEAMEEVIAHFNRYGRLPGESGM